LLVAPAPRTVLDTPTRSAESIARQYNVNVDLVRHFATGLAAVKSETDARSLAAKSGEAKGIFALPEKPERFYSSSAAAAVKSAEEAVKDTSGRSTQAEGLAELASGAAQRLATLRIVQPRRRIKAAGQQALGHPVQAGQELAGGELGQRRCSAHPGSVRERTRGASARCQPCGRAAPEGRPPAALFCQCLAVGSNSDVRRVDTYPTR